MTDELKGTVNHFFDGWLPCSDIYIVKKFDSPLFVN